MCKRVKCPHCGSEHINVVMKEKRINGYTTYTCASCSMQFVLAHAETNTKIKTPLEKLNDRVVMLEDRFNELVESINRLEEELKRRIL